MAVDNSLLDNSLLAPERVLAIILLSIFCGARGQLKQYLDLLQHVMDNGATKGDRTGTGTKSVFGYQMRFNLQEGFPCLTTKKLHLKSIIHELLWFLKGDTNIKYLKDNGVSIWDEWADEKGDLGPVYGYQWRSWPAPNGEKIDQIAALVKQIKNNPDSRRATACFNSMWQTASFPASFINVAQTSFWGCLSILPPMPN